MLFIFVAQTGFAATRTASVSGDWNSTATWGGSSVPGSSDDVIINSGITVTVTANATCSSLTFNAGTGGTVTVNSGITLTVTNAITLNYSTSSNVTAFISGNGSISCASLNVGNTDQNGGSNNFTHTLTATINLLSVSSDLTINSYYYRSGRNRYYLDGVFNINSGTINIGSSVVTSNSDRNNTATFTLGNSSPNLNLSGATPFNLSGTGANNITLNGTGATVEYSYAGAQTVYSTTYNNLTLSGSGSKTTSSVTVIDTLSMEGTATATSAPTYGGGATLQYKGSASQTTSAELSSPFSASGGVVINNSNGVTLSSSTTISSKLTLTSGTLTTSSTSLLSITNTATTAISGGSSTSFINGPVVWNLPSGLGSGTTFIFPVGKTTYKPLSLINPTTSGSSTVQVEAFNTSAGGTVDGTLDSISVVEYWQMTTSGNFTNTSITLARSTAIAPLNAIGTSSTLSGQYTSLYGTAGTYGVSSSDNISGNSTFYFALAHAKPIISVSTTSLSGFVYAVNNGPSAIDSVYISGHGLTANITVSVPPSSNYELSTSKSGTYLESVNVLINSGGTAASTPIYVRLKSGLTTGTYNDVITAASTGATSKTVNLSGSVTDQPLIAASPDTLTGLTYTLGSGPSTPQSFTLTGSNLQSNITVTAPTDFEVATSSGGTYYSSLSISPTSGSVNTTIYVRLMAGLSTSTYDENITLSATYANSKTVNCQGEVNRAKINLSKLTLGGFIYTTGAGPSGAQYFSVDGNTLSDTIKIARTTDFEISTDPAFSTSPDTIKLAPSSGVVSSTPIYVRLAAGLSTGTISPEVIYISSTGAITQAVTCSGAVVSGTTTISSKPTLNGFFYLYGDGPSITQSFTVSGTSLTSDITVMAPSDFEISSSGSAGTFGSTLTLTSSGGIVNADIVYIRLKSGLSINSYIENVTLSSPGASNETITCDGEVVAQPTITAGASDTSPCVGDSITLTSSGTNITNQSWSGPNSFYSSDQNPGISSVTSADSGNYVVTGSVMGDVNLLTNGDFSAGNDGILGFGSTYVHQQIAPSQRGSYWITSNPQDVYAGFCTCPDHTPGTDSLQMVVDGATTTGAIVWSETVEVQPNTDYQFSYWALNVNSNSTNYAQVQLYVDNVPIGSVNTIGTPFFTWGQFINNINTGSSTSLQLTLINFSTQAHGNDFSLDDMSFQQVFQVSDTIGINVNTIVTPAVSISTANTTILEGSPATFTATPTNGGASPTYQWYLNGSPVSGETSSTYTYTPSNGDQVYCIMTSSITCTTSPTATSNTITMTVNPRNNFWMGTNSTDWGTASNWTADAIPNPGDDVVFATVANYGSDVVNDLYLDQDRTIGNLINQSAKSLVIPPAKALTINSGISTNDNPNQIVIESAFADAPGSLIFGNNNNTINDSVYASIYFYSKAYTDSAGGGNDIFHWQYFGIPVKSVVAHPTFDGAYVRRWYEPGTDITNHWVALRNDSTLMSFYGYEICQDNPAMFNIQGILENRDFNSGQLSYTATALYPGQYVFANPYTAAINIKYLSFGSSMESTVYLYNTGTFQDWVNNNGESTNDSLASLPGQYTAIPKNVAGTGSVQGEIPSQQGFLVKVITADANATFSIPYNSVAIKNSTLRRVQATNSSVSDTILYIRFDLKTNRIADRMWLFCNKTCKPTFDNGWDGTKMFNFDSSVPQLFAIEPDGYYQVSTTNNLNNVSIGFRPGTESTYTLSMTCNNYKSLYQGVYLMDLTENKIIELTEDQTTEYTFSTDQHTNIENRFKIVTQYYEKNTAGTNTKVDVFNTGKRVIIKNESTIRGDVYIYDMFGRLMLIKQADANSLTTIHADNLTPGAYIVKVITNDSEFNKRIIL